MSSGSPIRKVTSLLDRLAVYFVIAFIERHWQDCNNAKDTMPKYPFTNLLLHFSVENPEDEQLPSTYTGTLAIQIHIHTTQEFTKAVSSIRHLCMSHAHSRFVVVV